MEEPSVKRESELRAGFPVTRWSLVLHAQEPGGESQRRALDELCRVYWFPLYAFARRKGFSNEDAEDLVQDFLSRILQQWLLQDVSPEKGKLRSWLLALFKPFIADHCRRANAKKRGGGAQVIPIDLAEAELRFQEGLDESTEPEAAFEKRWAVTVFGAALDSLEAEYRAAGKGEQFSQLVPHLQWQGDGAGGYASSAAALGVSEGNVRVAVYRLRRRFREALKTEVAHTLGPGEDVDEEVRYLLRVLAG